ncbi:hypothetical protein CC80DRAFT_487127 [Byssothecium circinans]|uniref:RRM domain-containing protein n=1 Tax=Byssothecium circinans TaxID=147558 RepID=A0A6A5UIL7_9PLEO|nr:hypothetical protein CC80DRAFT_487127 [Byssothecium circinans]
MALAPATSPSNSSGMSEASPSPRSSSPIIRRLRRFPMLYPPLSCPVPSDSRRALLCFTATAASAPFLALFARSAQHPYLTHKRYGRLVRCDIPAPRSASSRLFAFVEYENRRDADDAYHEMHNKRIGRDDLLKIEWARTPPSASWRFDSGRDRPREGGREGGREGRRSERDRSPRRGRSGSPRRPRGDGYSPRKDDRRDRDYDRRERDRTRSPDGDREMKDVRDRDDDRERDRGDRVGDRDRERDREAGANGDERKSELPAAHEDDDL